MISRRLLRIKVLQVLYSGTKKPDVTIAQLEKELFFSVQKAYDLYHYMLTLLIEISALAERKIEIAKNKKLPSFEDLNPNTKFLTNGVIEKLKTNHSLIGYVASNKLNWADYPEIIKSLLDSLFASDFYSEYMNNTENNFQEDKKFIQMLLSEVIYINENMYQALEEQSIYWNDDMDYVLNMVAKTIKKIKVNSNDDFPLLPLYKDNEDADFVKVLYRKSMLNFDSNQKLIDNFTTNWDLERIAQMDKIVMNMAITEIMEFPSIPVKVSLNEYIEIAKCYSTQKSNVFINGILDKLINQLRSENKIIKIGRGLKGENS